MVSQRFISPYIAAKLIEYDYYYPDQLQTISTITLNGVHAAVVRWGVIHVLVIRGTDQITDWVRYNFRFLPKVRHGDTTKWHAGFLAYAEIVYAYSKYQDVQLVCGHSLGAAAAQIVGPALDTPTITFAAPRPLYGSPPCNSGRVINYCRSDDLVCYSPFTRWGFSHVGRVIWLTPRTRHWFEDHRIPHYLNMLKADDI